MNTKEIINQFYAQLAPYDWFAGLISPSDTLHKTLIVYVNCMNSKVWATVPDQFHGFNVVVHFISSVVNSYTKPILLDQNIN